MDWVITGGVQSTQTPLTFPTINSARMLYDGEERAGGEGCNEGANPLIMVATVPNPLLVLIRTYQAAMLTGVFQWYGCQRLIFFWVYLADSCVMYETVNTNLAALVWVRCGRQWCGEECLKPPSLIMLHPFDVFQDVHDRITWGYRTIFFEVVETNFKWALECKNG